MKAIHFVPSSDVDFLWKTHLPFQQLFGSHILGEDLPGAVTGQRTVAQVVFRERDKCIRSGWRRDGQGQALTATIPTCTIQANAILFTLLTCWGRGMQAWQDLVLTGRGQWLKTEKEPAQ